MRARSTLLTLCYSALSLPLLLCHSTPAIAAGDCDTAVAEVGSKIQSIGAMVYRVKEGDVQGYQVPDAYRGDTNKHLTIYLENAPLSSLNRRIALKGESIMSSPAVKFSYAKQIFDNCKKYKMFTIVMWGTDWSSTYFKMPSGSPAKATCVTPGGDGGNNLMWGYDTCI